MRDFLLMLDDGNEILIPVELYFEVLRMTTVLLWTEIEESPIVHKGHVYHVFRSTRND